MSIHKTKEGKYQVRWRVEGKLKAKNFKRKIDADKFESCLKVAGFSQPNIVTPFTAATLFSEYVVTWIRDHGSVHKTEGSLVQDRQIIRDYLMPRWDRFKLESISRRDISKLQGDLVSEGRLSPKTINIIVGLCHKMFKSAVEWDLLKVNPVDGLKALKVPEKDYRFWTFEERDRFLGWAKANDPELHAIIGLAVYTGLRRGEVEGLLRDCIDFERSFIVVKRSWCKKTHKLNEYTKGKRIRRVPMNSAVVQILKEHSLRSLKDQVLPADYDHLVVRRFRPAQLKAGVNQICFHDLRHSFASHMAMSGVIVFDIQKLLGHSSIDTTMRYMHFAPDHLSGLTDLLLSRKSALREADGTAFGG